MEQLTLTELRAKAKKYKLKGYSGLNKQQLIHFISCSDKERNVRKIKRGPNKSAKWVIYTLKTCGYCHQLIDFLTKKGYEYKEIKVNNSNINKIYREIDSVTNSYRYFPIVFLNDKFIGGNKEVFSMFK
jgi:glutaredoxin